ncbi:MAG: hypothetical protein A2430_01955 [Candidatus Liptonbacteria bacterium RIFOXYC1_FULL_36_8]|uniref:Methyltransferase domain-containing protein n=2 Tax=Candidatus Liptoniibacteriota TaxID=1817909 RepID=A0A1G2CQ11_9BACT|nr:MAG: hypothetical protein A2604_00640 [Candidatus Liptonbacteria bacterium RIFOXYD1_FULL_36_11]OGZ03494.1 MAG: hypothetical protein A2430_01955 [Candidatus Liptonbacteria bacterium RIFOXYC1_FULL_36_8]
MKNFIKKIISHIKKFGFFSFLKTVSRRPFDNNFTNSFKLRFFINLHNLSYKKISSLAKKLNKGEHPKRAILKYENFFLSHIKPEDSVLDIGCHTGYLSFKAALIAKKVVGIDLNKKNISIAKEIYKLPNLSFISADATLFPFKEKFNKIILSNVLEHIENRIDFLKKISNLSDIILLRVPLIERDWLAVYKKENGYNYLLDSTHYIEYTLKELKEEVDKSDWKIENFTIKFGEFWGILFKK